LNLEPIVLAVVSEKTGYPIEMIDLDMDIEADLGIDSIKRVEIVAAIEERVPSSTSIQPENMGSLRTLRQIMAFMSPVSQSAGATEARAQNEAAAPMSDTQAVAPAGEMADPLLAVVSQLTGYPREMLDLDMDMESDLGIDSIKRVEILAAVEAKAPHFKTVNPESMGALRTLRQIVEFGAGSQAAEPPQVPAHTPAAIKAAALPETKTSPASKEVSPATSRLQRRVLNVVD
jgi:acyl carrier protein